MWRTLGFSLFIWMERGVPSPLVTADPAALDAAAALMPTGRVPLARDALLPVREPLGAVVRAVPALLRGAALPFERETFPLERGAVALPERETLPFERETLPLERGAV